MLRKLLIASLFVLMFTFTASAYTLVFRDGRRIDISSEFTVTRTTLTFEVSPGFNQTVLLTIVDIPATERANNESTGSFFKHSPADQSQPAPAPVGPARMTLTNSDLVAIKARRIESEKAYEQRRAELGIPTAEQTRRQREYEENPTRDRARHRAEAEARDEADWRGSAATQRAENQ